MDFHCDGSRAPRQVCHQPNDQVLGRRTTVTAGRPKKGGTVVAAGEKKMRHEIPIDFTGTS